MVRLGKPGGLLGSGWAKHRSRNYLSTYSEFTLVSVLNASTVPRFIAACQLLRMVYPQFSWSYICHTVSNTCSWVWAKIAASLDGHLPTICQMEELSTCGHLSHLSLWRAHKEDMVIHCLSLEDSIFFPARKEDGSLNLGLSRDFRCWSPGWSGLLNYLKIVSDLIL